MPEDNADSYEVTRDSVLYIVDASASMERADALNVALSSASWAIRDAAREGGSRVDAGVIIYNVSKLDSNNSSKAAYVLLSLQEPEIDQVKLLMRLSNSIDTFRSEYTPLEPKGESLISALRLANSEMNQLHTRSMRRVVLITNNDDPMKNEDSSKMMIVANLASDLTGSPAFLMPIFLKTHENSNNGHGANELADFDIRKFWINLNYMPPPIASAATNNFSSPYADDMWTNQKLLEPWDLSTLANPRRALILSKSRRRYITFKGKIAIGSLSIGVRAYNIVHFHHRPPPLKIAHVTNKKGQQFRELLVTERALAYSESGTEVLPAEDDTRNQQPQQQQPQQQQRKKAPEARKFKLGSSMKNEDDWTVPVTDDQLKELRHPVTPTGGALHYPSLFIHRFVPSESIRFDGCVGHSTFLVPSSDLFTQSWTAFASLHRTMRKRGLVALASFYPSNSPNRSNTPETGYIFAFNPAKNPEDLINEESEKNSQKPMHPDAPSPNTFDGMYFLPRPFADDLRNNPSAPSVKGLAKNENEWYDLQVNTKTLFTKFTLRSGFNPARFPHPLTAQFAEILEHHALHLPLETDSLERKDETRPRYEKIVKTSGVVLSKINANLDVLAPPPMPSLKAEDEAEAGSSKGSKRIKTETLTSQDIMEAFEANRLDKFTVRQLKDAISTYETPSSRLKAQLVQQLQELILSGKLK